LPVIDFPFDPLLMERRGERRASAPEDSIPGATRAAAAQMWRTGDACGDRTTAVGGQRVPLQADAVVAAPARRAYLRRRRVRFFSATGGTSAADHKRSIWFALSVIVARHSRCIAPAIWPRAAFAAVLKPLSQRLIKGFFFSHGFVILRCCLESLHAQATGES
jgi:hypothetical protein